MKLHSLYDKYQRAGLRSWEKFPDEEKELEFGKHVGMLRTSIEKLLNFGEIV